MAVSEKEKNRKLTPAEEKRLARYEETSRELEGRGYRRTELTIDLVKANIFVLLLALPVFAVSFGLFIICNHGRVWSGMPGGLSMFAFLAATVVLIVVHELIHGLTWGIFAENHMRDIEFGFIKEYLTPYCACTCPLTKGNYILGAVMPLVILGVIPTAIAIASGSMFLLWLGVIMVLSAGGDILIVFNILRHKSPAGEVLYMDHPTQGGGVIFEKADGAPAH